MVEVEEAASKKPPKDAVVANTGWGITATIPNSSGAPKDSMGKRILTSIPNLGIKQIFRTNKVLFRNYPSRS